MSFQHYLDRFAVTHKTLAENGTLEKYSTLQLHPAILATVIRQVLPSDEQRDWDDAFWFHLAKTLGKKDARRLHKAIIRVNRYVTPLNGE